MNNFNLSGLLTRDPDSNEKVTKISIANDRRYSKEKVTDYYDIAFFGALAETVNKYFKKGSAIEVTGRLQTNSYTTKEGSKVNKIELIGETIYFPKAGKRADSTDNKSEAKSDKKESFMDVPDGIDESLPFN